MLKKIIALAASTVMLGANAAAHAINSARAAVKGITGPAQADAAPVGKKVADGRDILPSIPPLPPEVEAKPKPLKANAGEARSNRSPKAKSKRGGAAPKGVARHKKRK